MDHGPAARLGAIADQLPADIEDLAASAKTVGLIPHATQYARR